MYGNFCLFCQMDLFKSYTYSIGPREINNPSRNHYTKKKCKNKGTMNAIP